MDGIKSSPTGAFSPKGNQNKWYEDAHFVKQDTFEGECLAEYLVSLVLEASNCPIPFIKYRLRTSNIVVAQNYKPRYSFIPFAKLLDVQFKKYKWKTRIVEQKGSIFKYWYKNYWSRWSASQRVDFVTHLFSLYGVSEEETLKYLTVMVELDTLVLNIDRHFNNFGIMYDHEQHRYIPSLLFDQGLSLATGVGVFGAFNQMLDLRKVKMQPFSTRVSKNRSALPEYKLQFDVELFVKLLYQTCILPKEALKVTPQFVALKRRLNAYYERDINGINILDYLKASGL